MGPDTLAYFRADETGFGYLCRLDLRSGTTIEGLIAAAAAIDKALAARIVAAVNAATPDRARTEREIEATAPPLSCGEAWIKHMLEVLRGQPPGAIIDDMQRAFDAGWDAAHAALAKARQA